MATPSNHALPTLNSWKEISAHLGKGVRTVQRYERSLALPIYRMGNGPKSPVHAYPGELAVWVLRHSSQGKATEFRSQVDEQQESLSRTAGILARRSTALLQKLTRSVELQHRQSEIMSHSIRDIRDKLKRSEDRDPVKARIIREQLAVVQKNLAAILDVTGGEPQVTARDPAPQGN